MGFRPDGRSGGDDMASEAEHHEDSPRASTALLNTYGLMDRHAREKEREKSPVGSPPRIDLPAKGRESGTQRYRSSQSRVSGPVPTRKNWSFGADYALVPLEVPCCRQVPDAKKAPDENKGRERSILESSLRRHRDDVGLTPNQSGCSKAPGGSDQVRSSQNP